MTFRNIIVAAAVVSVLPSCSRVVAPPIAPAYEPPPEVSVPRQGQRFEATAYAISGTTASGKPTRVGVVAADPRVLPLGTRIRVHDAGRYSGEYVVSDTGRSIKGREIDIYIPDYKAAKKFGRRSVRVEVLKHRTGEVGAR